MERKLPRLNWKALNFLWVFCALLLIPGGNAFEFKVGGPKGSWAAPSDPNAANYNQWAEKNRFQIGDTLLFVYDAGHDSVLHVTKEDYTSCNTAAPIQKFSDGHTVFKLDQSGPFYFISGEADNCKKNQKLVVVVMADRSKHNKSDEVPPPSPSPEVPPPAAAPVGGESPPPPPGAEGLPPSPAPSGEEPPTSPSESTPAPSQESPPHKNDAASTVFSGLGMVGALIGSWIVVAV